MVNNKEELPVAQHFPRGQAIGSSENRSTSERPPTVLCAEDTVNFNFRTLSKSTVRAGGPTYARVHLDVPKQFYLHITANKNSTVLGF